MDTERLFQFGSKGIERGVDWDDAYTRAVNELDGNPDAIHQFGLRVGTTLGGAIAPEYLDRVLDGLITEEPPVPADFREDFATGALQGYQEKQSIDAIQMSRMETNL